MSDIITLVSQECHHRDGQYFRPLQKQAQPNPSQRMNDPGVGIAIPAVGLQDGNTDGNTDSSNGEDTSLGFSFQAPENYRKAEANSVSNAAIHAVLDAPQALENEGRSVELAGQLAPTTLSDNPPPFALPAGPPEQTLLVNTQAQTTESVLTIILAGFDQSVLDNPTSYLEIIPVGLPFTCEHLVSGLINAQCRPGRILQHLIAQGRASTIRFGASRHALDVAEHSPDEYFSYQRGFREHGDLAAILNTTSGHTGIEPCGTGLNFPSCVEVYDHARNMDSTLPDDVPLYSVYFYIDQQYLDQHFPDETDIITAIQSRQEQLQSSASTSRSRSTRNRPLPLNLWLFRFRQLKNILSHFGIPVNSPVGTLELRVQGHLPQSVGSRVQGRSARVKYEDIYEWAGVERSTAANIRPIYLQLEAAYRANHPVNRAHIFVSLPEAQQHLIKLAGSIIEGKFFVGIEDELDADEQLPWVTMKRETCVEELRVFHKTSGQFLSDAVSGS
ncbi:hypothetical protein EVJ58_g8401 [Rhodofomes roseus]|uniref:Uncharacterized protein n=1 Tax=Rhodofomes roseus TaxID=34475 RepID=A0A4Y9XYL5_9APHY|nr:hypothetical protein EVJ58_g8401 [Rhodofomes roseus]